MEVWELLVGFALSVMGGIKSICGFDWWNGKETPLWRVWTEKRLYVLTGVWAVFYGLLWFASDKSILLVRSVDLLCTYGILAAVDGKRRIIPDSILLCYFTGQMLLGALSNDLAALLQIVFSGMVFTAAALVFAGVSKGKIGMGDVRLLGVTAMTVGWRFVMQVLILSVAMSFVYSIWLLIVCRKNIRTEFPFVPFLAAGMAAYMAFLI